MVGNRVRQPRSLPPATLAEAGRVAASTACLIGITVLAVALRYGLYEYFHGDGRTMAAVPSRTQSQKEGMAVTIVDTSRPVTGGVDTHLDSNVVAVLDGIGGLLGVESFTTSVAPAARAASCA